MNTTKNMRLEPDVPRLDYEIPVYSKVTPSLGDAAMLSLAVSMKRIADTLEAFQELAEKETKE